MHLRKLEYCKNVCYVPTFSSKRQAFIYYICIHYISPYMYCLFSVIIYIIAFFDLQKSFQFDESASINTVSSSAHATTVQ